MARLIVWVIVRTKGTDHTFTRELEQVEGVDDYGKAIQAFERGEAYETEQYFITKSETQPEDMELEYAKEFKEKLDQDRRRAKQYGITNLPWLKRVKLP
jgi:hypothetical protein